jgi:ABC-type antimicrobial peptide transport system permease subunit
MIKNYFTIAWRHLLKNRGYSLINIVGLGLGMTIALVIGLWVADEYSYNHYHKNIDRIAEVMNLQRGKNESFSTNGIATNIMGQTLHRDYPDLFEKVSLASGAWDYIAAVGDKHIAREGMYVEREFPGLFSYKMVYGSISALKDPSTILIAQTLATALFGNIDPTGKTVTVSNIVEYKVGGVYENLPANTTYHNVEMLFPWTAPSANWLNSSEDWNNHNEQCYVQLKPGVTVEQATRRIRYLPTPHIKDYHEEYMLYPLAKLHLYDHFVNAVADGGRIDTVRLVATIGAFVLLLACINFMNLSTARSEKRAKEVGIRKTVGSLRSQLIGQFLGESILTALLALVLAILLANLSLPFFNQLTAKDMHIPWTSPWFAPLVLAFTLLTGLLAGSYPAFYLSAFRPVKVLKGAVKAGRYASLPRQVLVVLQFTVSLTLIIATLFIYRQVQYSKARDVGYTREGLINVPMNTMDIINHEAAARRALLASGVVANVAASSQTVTGFWQNNDVYWDNKPEEKNKLFFRDVNISPEFGATIGWKVLQGRDFSRNYSTDSNNVILNDTAAKLIGFDNPLGKTITYNNKRYTIVGVVNNLITNSPYEPVQPALFFNTVSHLNFIIRLKPGVPMPRALATIEPIFKQYNPGSPFDPSFVDKDYAVKFESETQTGNLAAVFAGLAIFISCLGLFGLAAFVAEQRTREIGVRKVLGAGIGNLWRLLSKDFIRLSILSMFFAVPLAWYFSDKWLGKYTYHAPLSAYIFGAACAGILLITLATVSYQAVRAALMNPVKSLRSE